MNVQVQQQGDRVIIALEGELDVAVAPELKNVLKENIERGNRKIIVDMKDVKFIDSSCLGVLVNAHKLAVEKKGAIRFARSSDQVRKIFELTRTDRHLAFFVTIEEAAKSLDLP
jgi:anti-sigma B factor antagonist